MGLLSEFLNPKNYNDNPYGYTQDDVNKIMAKTPTELTQNYRLEQLNAICSICGGSSCTHSMFSCSVAAAIHSLDNDNVDLFGNSRYSHNIHEL